MNYFPEKLSTKYEEKDIFSHVSAHEVNTTWTESANAWEMLLHQYKNTGDMCHAGIPTQKKATGLSSSPQGEQWQQELHRRQDHQWLRCKYLHNYNKVVQDSVTKTKITTILKRGRRNMWWSGERKTKSLSLYSRKSTYSFQNRKLKNSISTKSDMEMSSRENSAM